MGLASETYCTVIESFKFAESGYCSREGVLRMVDFVVRQTDRRESWKQSRESVNHGPVCEIIVGQIELF